MQKIHQLCSTESIFRGVKQSGQGVRKMFEYCDFFGHPVAFNFNKKGGVHNTWYGGLVSIGIRIALIVYIVRLVQRMHHMEESFNQIETQ